MVEKSAFTGPTRAEKIFFSQRSTDLHPTEAADLGAKSTLYHSTWSKMYEAVDPGLKAVSQDSWRDC